MAAPKKTTAAKKAVEVKSVANMQKQLAEMQQDLMTSRRSHRAGELVNPRVLSTLRKDIARLMTAIRAAEISADKESK